jgi:hypothetical protein
MVQLANDSQTSAAMQAGRLVVRHQGRELAPGRSSKRCSMRIHRAGWQGALKKAEKQDP